MKFPQDFIERVREASNIIDVIGQYVQLRRTGHNHQGLCPFHNEKSPSFSVSEDKQVYHCFGCKASGNVFSFVQNYQGLTFPEAVEFLARRAGLPIPQVERGENPRSSKEPLFRVNALAANFFVTELKKLPSSHPVKEYLRRRGLSEELVETHKLGYAPDAWTQLTDLFDSKKVPLSLAEQLGLIKRRTGGKTGHYDIFRHRLMFPIISSSGQVLGFGGRVLNKEHQPKYLNSPDSPIFHKGKVFYGLNFSGKYIRAADEAIIVEGYMDWLALVKGGVTNVVATLGTALTPDHARAIKRFTNKVLLLFDGDEAGRSAARRSLPILLEEGILCRGLILPDDLDPDDYINKFGADKLKALIAAAPDLFEIVAANVWMESKGSPSGKVRFLDEMSPILERVSDGRLKTLYIQNLANLIDVAPALIEQSVKKPVKRREVRPQATPEAPKAAQEPDKIDLKGLPKPELELLNVILLREVYLKEALASGVFTQISHPGGRKVFGRLQELYGLMPNKFDMLSALIAGEVCQPEMVTRHLTDPYRNLTDDGAAKLLQDCILRVKDKFLRNQSKELLSGLRALNPADSADQLEQIMNVHRNRRSLARDS